MDLAIWLHLHGMERASKLFRAVLVSFRQPNRLTVCLVNLNGSGLQKLEGWTKVKLQWYGADNAIGTCHIARTVMEEITTLDDLLLKVLNHQPQSHLSPKIPKSFEGAFSLCVIPAS